MADPAPIRGRWTILWPDNCERWTVTVADGHDPHDEAGWKHIPVVPVPDEAAIERGAMHLFGREYIPRDRERAVRENWPQVSEDVRRVYRAKALAVLRAALEDGQ